MTAPTPQIGPLSEYRLRAGRPSDHPLVVDSWVRTHAESVAGRDAGPRYVPEQKALVRHILTRAATILSVAVAPDDEDAILGWAAYSLTPPIAHYVYVRPQARMCGIARSLLAPLLSVPSTVYSHRPPVHFVETRSPTLMLGAPASCACSSGACASCGRRIPAVPISPKYPIPHGWTYSHTAAMELPND